MKVPPSRQNGSRAAVPASSGQAGKAPAIPFSAYLQGEGEALRKARLDKLHQDLMAMAERLSLASPLSEWESFRQGVAAYLAEVKKHYLSRRSRIPDRAGNQRLLVLIEQADQELSALSLEFLSSAQDDLDVLARLKRLTGLLLDIRS